MTSRRQFLQAGLAASVLPAADAASLGSFDAGLAPAIPLYKVLYDVRFADSVAFARRAAARGLTVQAMRGDVTSIWYDDLYHRWREGPAAIAGLTAHGALFCLERLAWDQRMRVVYRGRHAGAGAGVAHRFEGPAELVARAASSALDSAWPVAVADIVADCPAERSARGAMDVRTERGGAVSPPAEELFSWVIAPVRRA